MIASQIDISKALNINGWMTERELIWLASSAQKCERIVEFGSYLGRSTRALADNTSGRVWAVDPWNGDYPTEDGSSLEYLNTFVMPQFIHNLEDHVKSGKVTPVRGFSTSFKLDEPVDMVFIDGDHTYKTLKKDINVALNLLRKGGIISGHDYGHPLWTGVERAVHELLGPVNVEDSIWWTLKS
jgi:hypothetical protein